MSIFQLHLYTKTMFSIPPPRVQLDRTEWINAAVDLLANAGIDGLRVEVLAKNMKVTKGSFYWHFKDRQDLLTGILAFWREGRIRDIEKQSAALPGQERTQLKHLIEVYSAARNRKGMAIELAMRDWARRDSAVLAIVEEVETYRLDCTSRLFQSAGLNEREAKARSLLLYAYVFGQSLMHYERFDEKVPALREWVADLIVN